MKKIISLVLALAAMLSLLGCSRRAYKYSPLLFTEKGMEITLTEGFERDTIPADSKVAVAIYRAKEVVIFVIKEEFAKYESLDEMTTEEYAGLIQKNYASLHAEKVRMIDGLVTVKYKVTTNEGQNLTYFNVVFKGSDGFWIFQFNCKTTIYNAYEAYFIQWAKSIKVQ